MGKCKDDNELVNKVIDLCLINEIKDSEIYLKLLDNQIKFYQTLIERLEDNKPLFFQKKKLIEYNNKKEDYENKISELYAQFGKEYDLIEKLHSEIS